MKKWNFHVKKSSKEITKKLESSLGLANRFAVKIHSKKNEIVKFQIRKRVLVAFSTSSQDQVIVNGKIFNAAANKADIEISFTQHPLLKLLWVGHIILGLGFLAGLFFELSNNSYVIIVGVILLAIGVFLRLHHLKEFNKNVQDYKKLISQILEI